MKADRALLTMRSGDYIGEYGMLLKGTYRYAFEHELEVALYTLDAEQQKKRPMSNSARSTVYSGQF